MYNYFTIDVEDWFQVFYGRSLVPVESWVKQDHKINGMIDYILKLLETYNVMATFFFVGWLADHHPEIIMKVAKAGHEIAVMVIGIVRHIRCLLMNFLMI